MAFLRRGAGFHIKALNHVECYPPRANVPEFEPQIKRNAKEMEPYNPHRFVHGSVMAADHRLHNPQSWADGEEVDAIDWSSAERKSYYGVVHLNAVTKTPVNPFGRTGMCGRGLLGRWGPNHASDLIVTRTNPNDDSKTDFVAIKRRDNGEWALPGGMVNLGERVSNAAIREFKEEALRCLGKDDEEPNSEKRSAAESKAVKSLDSIISNGGDIIFKGYVDDPRNTDDAWIETCATHYHATKEQVAELSLCAGDDAVGVKWMTIDDSDPEYLNLYASHKEWVDVVDKNNKEWVNCSNGMRKRMKC